jgi:hypothetical protein
MTRVKSLLKSTIRTGIGFLPADRRDEWEHTARRRIQRIRRRPRWGNLRRFTPVSTDWGGDRGTPVDRYFFDRFLREHAALIRGRVLEILDDTYSRTYGGDAVTSTLVVDIDGTNLRADLIADLCEPGSLRDERVDSIVLTQTIGLLPDYPAALINLWNALNPGGAMLITNNVVGRVAGLSDGLDTVRHTPLGLRLTVERVLPEAEVVEFGWGNLVTSIALLEGIAAEELTEAELTHDDPMFPTSCAVIARKPAAQPPSDQPSTIA